MEIDLKVEDSKREKIFKILCTPIECNQRRGYSKDPVIKLNENDKGIAIIHTSQLYKRGLDCDMSDFACG